MDLTPFSRRRLLAVGGLSALTSAIVAACGNSVPSQPARVGQAPSATALPNTTNTVATHLRTAASIEHLLIELYGRVAGDTTLVAPEHAALFTRLIADHEAAATALGPLTTEQKVEPWTCGNPRLQSALVDPALDRIANGVPARQVPASDNPQRDILSLANVLESMSAAMYQEMVGLVTDPALRATLLGHGVDASRRAAVLALAGNPERPQAYVTPADAQLAGVELPPSVASTIANPDGPALTEIPTLRAIPAQFGLVGTQILVVGAGDENGVRFKANVETPHDNSRIFDYMACPA